MNCSSQIERLSLLAVGVGLICLVFVRSATALQIQETLPAGGESPSSRSDALVIPSSKLFNMAHPERMPNQYIVVFKEREELARDVPNSRARSLGIASGELPTTSESVTSIGLAMAERYRSANLVPEEQRENLRKIRHVYSNVFHGFSIDGISPQQIATLAQDPRIKYVEADVAAHPASVFESVENSGGYICNDDPTQFASTSNPCDGVISVTAIPCSGSLCAPWNLDRIDQRIGLDGAYHYYATGAGVTIWVLDTGLQYNHNDFGGRAGNSIIGFVDNGMTVTPTTFPNSSAIYGPFCCDDTGHGTAVASVAAGTIAGVAKGATVRGIQAYKTQADLIAGVDYVIQNKSAGPNIINFSVIIDAGDSLAPTLKQAVTAATNAGITIVSAAGNETASACGYAPGEFVNVINVGNADKTDTPDLTSNYGPCIALFAPGIHVTIAYTGPSVDDHGACIFDSDSNSRYCTDSGTSYSAPMVAGIAALYLENNPTANFSTVRTALLKAASSGVINDPRSGSGSPNLLASAWVPGNSDGTTVSPGNGVPPGNSNAFNALAPILNLLLNGKKQ